MSGRIVKRLEGCGLPADALCDCARVTLAGRSSATVEGQHGVIELSQERIRLRTGEGMLLVCGSGLSLKSLSPDCARISGEQIDTISYLNQP